jgi:L-seryl-tRNA(Ser) seleniumtransferase
MIVGKKKLIDKIRKDPMYRVLRICKLTLSALEGTLTLFRQPEKLNEAHPLYTALSRTAASMDRQAEKISKVLNKLHPDWTIEVIDTVSMLGGGSLPGSDLPSKGIALSAPTLSADKLASAFRNAPTPVFGRIEKKTFILDMRAITSRDEKAIKETAALI